MKKLINYIGLILLFTLGVLSVEAQTDTCLAVVNYQSSNCSGALPNQATLSLEDENGVSKDNLVVDYMNGSPVLPVASANGLILWDGTLNNGSFSNLEIVVPTGDKCILTSRVIDLCSWGGTSSSPITATAINSPSTGIEIQDLDNGQKLDSLVITIGGVDYIFNDTDTWVTIDTVAGNTGYTVTYPDGSSSTFPYPPADVDLDLVRTASTDCEGDELDLILNGTSIGAFNEGVPNSVTGQSTPGNDEGIVKDFRFVAESDGYAIDEYVPNLAQKLNRIITIDDCTAIDSVVVQNYRGNTVFVDGVRGNDNTCKYEREDLPCETYAQAYSLFPDTVYQQTMVVYPDHYIEPQIVISDGNHLNITSVGEVTQQVRINVLNGDISINGDFNIVSDANGDGRINVLNGDADIDVTRIIDTTFLNRASVSINNGRMVVEVEESLAFYQANTASYLNVRANVLSSRTGAIVQGIGQSEVHLRWSDSEYFDSKRGAFTFSDVGTVAYLNGGLSTSYADDNVISQSGSTVNVLSGRYVCEAQNGTGGNPRAPFYFATPAGLVSKINISSGVVAIQNGNWANSITHTGGGTAQLRLYEHVTTNRPSDTVTPGSFEIPHGTVVNGGVNVE